MLFVWVLIIFVILESFFLLFYKLFINFLKKGKTTDKTKQFVRYYFYTITFFLMILIFLLALIIEYNYLMPPPSYFYQFGI
jgi:TRAP-type C4-dicarboxylate transport system permease small subunit